MDDEFHSVTWNSSSDAEEAVVETVHSNTESQSPGPSGGSVQSPRTDFNREIQHGRLETTVSEPQTENDGTKDAFVSYLVTTDVWLLAF